MTGFPAQLLLVMTVTCTGCDDGLSFDNPCQNAGCPDGSSEAADGASGDGPPSGDAEATDAVAEAGDAVADAGDAMIADASAVAADIAITDAALGPPDAASCIQDVDCPVGGFCVESRCGVCRPEDNAPCEAHTAFCQLRSLTCEPCQEGRGDADRSGECECLLDPVDPTDARCDGLDGDCDGDADEGYVARACGEGICREEAVRSRCEGGVETACVPGEPVVTEAEHCNQRDEDCDGEVDEAPAHVQRLPGRQLEDGLDGRRVSEFSQGGVAWDGLRFAAVWRHDSELYLRHVAVADGMVGVPGDRIPLLVRDASVTGGSLAWNGAHYGVAWDSDQGLGFRRATRDGALVGDVVSVVGGQVESFALATAGADWFVAVKEDSRVRVQRVDADGVVAPGPPLAGPIPAGDDVVDGKSYLAASADRLLWAYSTRPLDSDDDQVQVVEIDATARPPDVLRASTPVPGRIRALAASAGGALIVVDLGGVISACVLDAALEVVGECQPLPPSLSHSAVWSGIAWTVSGEGPGRRPGLVVVAADGSHATEPAAVDDNANHNDLRSVLVVSTDQGYATAWAASGLHLEVRFGNPFCR